MSTETAWLCVVLCTCLHLQRSFTSTNMRLTDYRYIMMIMLLNENICCYIDGCTLIDGLYNWYEMHNYNDDPTARIVSHANP